MPIFRCLVLGENFPVVQVGKRKLIGFYTTRFVEAVDESDAERTALNLLKDEDWLESLRLNRKADDPESMVYFEEIIEVEAIGVPNSGFTFFDMD